MTISRVVDNAGQDSVVCSVSRASTRIRNTQYDWFPFVATDALVLKVRESERVVNVHALVAVGVNADG